ncbi:MAG: hypothetical protein A3F67_07330 [Verrucomicrobia bacterium RIFCSPHIGHO2_12_FULL_41_10]|nr:MAG: hypothetical protein A3F67_07330 [Verrucomicrobia bacterium RIFCSPHIGHO2_12_FULL_41_10]HLB33730.1 type II secretion system protein GspG [Chthoniobacterales bacterium]
MNKKFSAPHAFTLLELLVVITLLLLLSSLVVGMTRYAFRSGARCRAQAEITSLSAALESYKNDHGDYPTNDICSDTRSLITALMPPAAPKNPYPKVYFFFSSKMTNEKGILDPFGGNYHYIYTNGSPHNGLDSFDLWSTAGDSKRSDQWIKNWE